MNQGEESREKEQDGYAPIHQEKKNTNSRRGQYSRVGVEYEVRAAQNGPG